MCSKSHLAATLIGLAVTVSVAQAQNNRNLNPTNDPDVQRGIDNYRRPGSSNYNVDNSSGSAPSPPPNGNLGGASPAVPNTPPRYVPPQRPVGH